MELIVPASAAAFAAGEEGAEGGKDVGEETDASVDDDAVGNKTADALGPAGGLGRWGIELADCGLHALTRGLQLLFRLTLPLPQGGQYVGRFKYAAHGSASSSASGSS